MKYAMEHNYDYLQNMDADFSHPPRYLPGHPRRDEQVRRDDRFAVRGGRRNGELAVAAAGDLAGRESRSCGSSSACRCKDASGAYRCYRVSKLRETRLDRVRSRGYSFQQEVLFRCHKAGCKLGEFPIIFENRRAGTSKVNRKEAVRSMSMILYLGLRNFLGLER